MKLTFTGKQTPLTPAQQRKLDARVERLSKLLDRRGDDKTCHAVLTTVRHLQKAEVTANFYDRQLVGVGSNSDQLLALLEALDNLEKQALRQRAKWRDSKRGSVTRETKAAAAASKKEVRRAKPELVPEPEATTIPAKIVRAGAKPNGKPMTMDEAVLAMDAARDYLVYRDSETNRVSVLVRRRDGQFDLIEA